MNGLGWPERSAAVLIRDVIVEGRPVDVALSGAAIDAVGPSLPRRAGEEVLLGAGGELLPGLHDHHVHLRAVAAAADSVAAGPPEVSDRAGLAAALAQAARRVAPGAWVRAVGYDESVAGHLDRTEVDSMVPDVAVRIQHRSGILWVLNSEALRLSGAEASSRPGIERDSDGRATGRLWREDRWLRDHAPAPRLDLPEVGRQAAACGVTGFTDATPLSGAGELEDLLNLAASSMPQRVWAMAAPGIALGAEVAPLAVKLLLDDDRLPSPEEMAGEIARSHGLGLPVAIHCVTRLQAVYALAALEAAGARPGDRLEHAAVLGADLLPRVRGMGLTVVTQPAFVHSRGDRYLEDVEPDDLGDLWRLASLIRAGVASAAGSDSPYGSLDPWTAVEAASRRLTSSGLPLGLGEATTRRRALELYLGSAAAPARPRRVVAGQPADLCLLEAPLEEAGPLPGVAATVVGGRVVHRAG